MNVMNQQPDLTSIDSPILLLIYNRPGVTKKVIKHIKALKPARLFIAADGPSSDPEDTARCQKCRDVVLSHIDWDCEIKTLFRKRNKGCGVAVSGGINWFFKHVDRGIIIEDDVLPDYSFFKFCDLLLEKYHNEPKIMQIKATHLHACSDDHSYYFSKIGGVWGWATWADSWNRFALDADYDKTAFETHFNNRELADFYYSRFSNYKRTDSWGGQWNYAIIKHKGLTIEPRLNLVENIGFNTNATHTKNPNTTLRPHKLTFPLSHPPHINYKIDRDICHIRKIMNVHM